MSFRIGQRVVCIEDGNNIPGQLGIGWGPGEAVYKGQIYTVARFFYEGGLPTVWLDEVARCDFSRLIWGDGVGYAAERFRPVKETSIEVFTAMLAPTPKQKVRV